MTPPDSIPTGEPEEQDAFLRGVLRTIQWVQANSRAVTIGAVLAAGGIAAAVYYQSYRQDVRRQAATRLQTLQSRLQARSSSDTLARTIREFVDRYGDTRYGDEGRLLMGRIELSRRAWQEAVSVLRPVVDEHPADSPTGYAARRLLGAAYEGTGNVAQAVEVYADLAKNAHFSFQRNEAAADRARLLMQEGRPEEAVRIYEQLVERADTSAAGVASEDLRAYRLKLGEARARAAVRSSDSAPAPGGGTSARPSGSGG